MKHIKLIMALVLALSGWAQAQTLSIGDVITNPDGSKGVVFYVNRDRTDGWMVEMNEHSVSQWGSNQDIPTLTESSTPIQLLHETDGFHNTEIIRQFHSALGYSSQSYAAGMVDFDNEWYLPSASQLMKLCSALRIVNESLRNNGGTIIQNKDYVSSSESDNGNKIWGVQFGSNTYDGGGKFESLNKTSTCSFRAVRNIVSVTPEPQVVVPDNIIETECNQSETMEFLEPQLLHSTGNNVHSYATPICGDIDGDGIVEIVIAHYYNGGNELHYRYWTNQIGVYRGTDLSLISTINIPEEAYLQYNPIGLVRYPLENGEMEGAIVVVCRDNKIRSYSKYGTLLHISSSNVPCDGTPSFADFNNDGHPELYIGNAIFDAATLALLCQGSTNGNMGLSHRGSPWSQGAPHQSYYAIPFACNLFGDQNLELVCGNTIYNVNISSRTNPSLNSVSVNKIITPPNGFPQDGQVAVADFDLDGELEVLVNRDNTHDSQVDNSYIYAYKPSNGRILFSQTIYCRSIGYPVVSNIDHDPYLEILFNDYQRNVIEEKLYCWCYIANSGLTTKWTYHHNDPSGMTTMALFDFNKDEIPEVVYRDASDLNIFNCSGKSHITGNDTINCYILYRHMMASGTAGEHPIIADVNNDGSAEIITNGLPYNTSANPNGNLHTFGNPNWPAARPVWNQYAYNVTNVNEDLTIPTHCFNNATVFTDPNGVVRRPFNNFMQQATYLDQYGDPYNPTGIVEIDVYGEGCGTYTYHGTTYTEGGVYEQLIENPVGCDTLATVHVNMVESFFHSFTASGCNSYTWNGVTYNESGVYQQHFISTQGCDSVVQMQLTIKPSPYVSEIEGPTFIYISEHGTYSYSIEPVEGAHDYVWYIDNNWTINNGMGSNSCSVNVSNVGAGTLTVRVYTECGYIERKIHIEHSLQPDIVVFPNPTYGDFKLLLIGMDGETLIEIYNPIGQRIAQFKADANVSGTLVDYSLKHHACGVYLISVSNRYRNVAKKLVKDTR